MSEILEENNSEVNLTLVDLQRLQKTFQELGWEVKISEDKAGLLGVFNKFLFQFHIYAGYLLITANVPARLSESRWQELLQLCNYYNSNAYLVTFAVSKVNDGDSEEVTTLSLKASSSMVIDAGMTDMQLKSGIGVSVMATINLLENAVQELRISDSNSEDGAARS